MKRSTTIFVFILALFLYNGLAYANSGVLNSFRSSYPDSQSDNASCQLCHGQSTNRFNQYGYDLFTNNLDFVKIQGFSSINVNGGTSYLDEINASTQPGWTTGALNPLYTFSDWDSETTAPGGIGALDPVGCDTNPPNITTPDNLTVTLAAGNNGPLPISDIGIQNFLDSASATDDEDGNLSVTNNAPASFPVGTTQVTFFATDSCGNNASATASVTVVVADNSLPVVTAPGSIEVTASQCETSVAASDSAIADFLMGATATDAEDGNVTASITNDAPAEFPAGTVTTVTFTATDSLGANGAATATVTVNETPNAEPAITAPVAITIMVPAGTTSVPASDIAIAAFLDGATATDAEDGDISGSITDDAPAEFPVGTTSVTFSVVDNCGVSVNAASTVTIQEEGGNIAPVLNVPDQITVNTQLCESSLPATDPTIVAFLNGATAFDAEDGDVTASITNNAPAEFPVGTTEVTFSVTDSNGATTTGVASVMVASENTAPVIIGPSPLSITVSAGTTSVPATDTAIAAFLNSATATDAEDGDFPSSAITNNAPTDFPMGETTVTFSVTDGCGLAATANSTVTITENQLSYEETDDEIDDGENEHYKENNGHKNRKYEKENKNRNKETQSSTKLRLLREEDDD